MHAWLKGLVSILAFFPFVLVHVCVCVCVLGGGGRARGQGRVWLVFVCLRVDNNSFCCNNYGNYKKTTYGKCTLLLLDSRDDTAFQRQVMCSGDV